MSELNTFLTEIADALRTKKGTSDKINAQNFVSEIESIEAGGSTAEEWKPNPTWWDIDAVLANDTRDYPYKAVLLLYANDVKTSTLNYGGVAYATSDGAFYEGSTVEHTWDLTQDKSCLIDGVEVYKTRYVIVYGNNSFNLKTTSIYNKISVCAKVKYATAANVFKDDQTLRSLSGEIDTSTSLSFRSMFNNCYSLQSIPKQLDTSKASMFDQMFNNCYSLQNVPKQLDTSKGTDFSSMFYNCYSLTSVPQQLDTSKGTTFRSMFYNCYSLQNVPKQLDTSKGTTFSQMFYNCYSLISVPKQLDMSNAAGMYGMFNNCYNLTSVSLINTSKCTDFSQMFYNCYNLTSVSQIDLINTTTFINVFSGCKLLTNLTLKNIKCTLTIGSGTSYGHLLTLDSLINTVKELWDYSSGTTTYTLTMGTANTAKITKTYVKLITPTAEMIAADPNIESKMPCEVCESTDEGAMLLKDYAGLKNWLIQ